MSHVFIFGFATLLVFIMELTWPVKGRSYVENKPCATHLVSENHVKPISVLEESKDAESN